MNVVCSHCKKEWKGLDHLRKDFKQGDFILYSTAATRRGLIIKFRHFPYPKLQLCESILYLHLHTNMFIKAEDYSTNITNNINEDEYVDLNKTFPEESLI